MTANDRNILKQTASPVYDSNKLLALSASTISPMHEHSEEPFHQIAVQRD